MEGFGQGMGLGMGWGWFIGLVVLVLIVLLIVRSLGPTTADKSTGAGESALDVLKKRYARGEIDKEEFEEKKKDLM